MLSEGVLAADAVWDREVEDLIEVVRFVYQRFADYRIARALLDQYGSEKESPDYAYFLGIRRCRRRDSNPRHADYDSAALTS